MELIEYVDSVNVRFGATTQRYTTASPQARELERRALENDLHLLQASCKHLGTEKNLEILKNLYEYLRSRAAFRFGTRIREIVPGDKGGFALNAGEETFTCDYLVAAPGRSGAEWFATQCKDIGLRLMNNQVDVASGWSCPQRCSSTSPTRCTRPSWSTAPSVTATRCAPSA